MNKVILCGRIVKDIEVKQLSGTQLSVITLAVQRDFKKVDKQEADFINCKVFGKNAENIQKWFKKGMTIIFEARIQTGSYEKDNKKIYTTDIIVDRFHFAGKKEKEEEYPDVPLMAPNEAENLFKIPGDDELPW